MINKELEGRIKNNFLKKVHAFDIMDQVGNMIKLIIFFSMWNQHHRIISEIQVSLVD